MLQFLVYKGIRNEFMENNIYMCSYIRKTKRLDLKQRLGRLKANETKFQRIRDYMKSVVL